MRWAAALVIVTLFAGCVTVSGVSAQPDLGQPAEAGFPDKPAVFGVGQQLDVAVTMRDGTVLKANIYYPTLPGTNIAAPGPFPVLLNQSPYGKWIPTHWLDGLATNVFGLRQDYFVQRGYIEVVADVRGTGGSEGALKFWEPVQALDGVDLVNWAARLPNSTGVVGTYGPSYLGINQIFTAAEAGRDSPLKAIAPMVPSSDMMRDVALSGGVPRMLDVLGFFIAVPGMAVVNPILDAAWNQLNTGHSVDVPTVIRQVREHLQQALGYIPDKFEQFINGEAGPLNYDGDWWDTMKPGEHLGQIVDNEIPALLIGGWNDPFQRGTPRLYSGLQNAWAGKPIDAPMSADQPVTGRYQLIEGSGYHANSVESLDIRRITLAWFDRWLKDEHNGIDDTSTPVHANIYGTDQWIENSSYPFAGAEPTRYYLTGDHSSSQAPSTNNGSLSTTAPDKVGSDRIRYNPLNFGCGRNFHQWTLGALPILGDKLGGAGFTEAMDRCLSDDRVIQSGDNVVTYTTDPMSEDHLLAGPMTATIKARATTIDTTFIVNVEDVAPDGASKPLTQGALAGRQRAMNPERTWKAPNGAVVLPYRDMTAASDTPVTPRELTEYVIEVFPTLAPIPAGHRVRLTVGTADFPSRVPNLKQYNELQGGIYDIQYGGPDGSYADLPLVPANSLGGPCRQHCQQTPESTVWSWLRGLLPH
ncbi:hypothetical protein AW168_33075 [Nocardia brasiliensis]|nr:hypothetical protein AW168_33075 [Nocardia brasiliensis]